MPRILQMEDIPSNAVAAAPAMSSASDSPSPHQAQKESKRNKKEPSTLVVACQQWLVSICSPRFNKHFRLVSSLCIIHESPLTSLRHPYSRLRKVRCDSGRPHCKNCTRRCDPCEYDTTPKRRGPDKVPGRTRMYKKKPEGLERANQPARQTNALSDAKASAERRVLGGRKIGNNSKTNSLQSNRTENVLNLLSIALQDVSSMGANQLSQTIPATAIGEPFDDDDLHDTLGAAGFSLERFLSSEQSAFGDPFDQLSNTLITSVEQVPQIWSQNIPSSIYQASRNYYTHEQNSSTGFSEVDYIPRGPSVSFYKQTWWDSLLPLYSPDPSQSALRIYQDLQFLYVIQNSSTRQKPLTLCIG
jgi:hypothetical protein